MARRIVRSQNTLLFSPRPWASSIPFSVPHPRMKNRLAQSCQTDNKVCGMVNRKGSSARNWGRERS